MDRSARWRSLADHVHREFEAHLKCGRLEHGFLRVRYDKCHFERLVAFFCKKRGLCPSCSVRRMAETAALLADEVFPDVPLRQRVISLTQSTRRARGAVTLIQRFGSALNLNMPH